MVFLRKCQNREACSSEVMSNTGWFGPYQERLDLLPSPQVYTSHLRIWLYILVVRPTLHWPFLITLRYIFFPPGIIFLLTCANPRHPKPPSALAPLSPSTPTSSTPTPCTFNSNPTYWTFTTATPSPKFPSLPSSTSSPSLPVPSRPITTRMLQIPPPQASSLASISESTPSKSYPSHPPSNPN